MTKPLKRLPSTPSTNRELTERLNQAQTWTKEAEQPAGAYPWESAHPRVKVGYALRMGEPLYAKVKFLAEHEPNTSMHKLIIEAIEALVEERLGKYVKK